MVGVVVVTLAPLGPLSAPAPIMSDVFGIDFSSWSTAEWAEVLSAVFTAVAAGAAWATVFRFERDRRRSSWPDLHCELVVDMPHQQVRLTVVNYGGPAREVNIYGVAAGFGFMGTLEPSGYWQPGERRTFHVHMPPALDDEAKVFVEGRDMAKRHLFVATIGGATYRWPLWRARRLSAEREWRKLFPGSPNPLDAQGPMRVEVIEREVAGRVVRHA
jgi:hypothetical protein